MNISISSSFLRLMRRDGRGGAALLLATLIACAFSGNVRAADGDLDPSFGSAANGRGADERVYATAVKPDGKIVIGGIFTTFDGLPRRRVAQLNADGSVDTSFNPGTGVSSPTGVTNDVQDVNAVAVQQDGKILIGGFFTGYNGTPVKSLARINADGSLDTSFNAGNIAFTQNGTIFKILVQGDGKIIVAGSFDSYNNIPRNNVARLNSDGSLDRTYNEGTAPGTNSLVSAIALQSDGKLIIGGGFTNVRGTPRARVARLDTEGRVDTTFNPGTGADQQIFDAAVQKDGKILISGILNNYNGVARRAVARLNTDGSLDTSFDPGVGPDGVVYEVDVQFNGKVLIAGAFNKLNGVFSPAGIARLNPNGTHDSSFVSGLRPGSGADVRALALQPDGKIIIGGVFTSYQDIQRRFVARLFSTPAPIATKGPPLSPATDFTVNGSSTGIAVPADSVLRFRVKQPTNAAGLIVRVQFSTTPESETSWTDLNNGSFGRMIFDVTNGSYVLNTTSYPRSANVHFRTVSEAPTRSDSVSNSVGSFNLTSSAQHLGRTILSTTRNGVGAKINFRAFDETHPAGISMRIQSSTSPGDEGSWTDLPDGNGGKMAPYRNPGDFFLDSKDYPANGAVYFRTVASAPGYVDSPSRGVGPFNLSNSPAPTVTVTSPARPGGALGGDFQYPELLPPGGFIIEANAQPNGGPAIKHTGLIFDGETIARFDGDNASRSYTAAAPGDHVIEAFALDELNVSGDSTPIFVRVAPAFGKIYNRVEDGDWSNASGWRDQDLQLGVPGPNDLANIGSFNVSLSQDITALAVALHGGSINGPAALTITGTFTISAGRLPIPNLTVERGGTLLLANEFDIAMGGNVTNLGKVMLIGRAGITGIESGSSAKSARASDSETVERKQFFKGVVAFFKNLGDLVLGRRTGGKRTSAPPAPQPVPDIPRTVLLDIDNGGNVIGQDAAGLIGQDGAGVISDNGLGLIGQDGAGIVSSDGASIISSDGASIISSDGASIISSDGASIISGGGGNIISGGAGNFLPGARAAAATKAGAKAATGQNGFIQTGGTTNLTGIRLIGPVVLNGGVLAGSGVIVGDLTNDGGYIAPGSSAGSITVDGNFTQTANGSLLLEVGGTNSYIPEFDRLKIAGNAALGGKLSVKTINGFTPDPSTRFVPLSYESATGSFASTSGNVRLELTDTGAALTIAGANPPGAKLLNIATRLRVERGQDALIGGFIITGSAPKRVIIRALGPSLAERGIAGGLVDPTLELFRPDGLEFNDNWRDSQEGDIAATSIQPSDDREAAIVATLEPGVGYTAVVRGVDDTTGVGLVEVYDLDAAAPSTLANISTRGLVQTGENVMIGGLIIGGDQPAKVLVRAIGPSLGAAGVEGALQDPTLELYTAQGAVITNDDWRATQEGEIIASTVSPSDSREAAILATLPPGNYTAIVRGKGDTTGVALVEAYNLQ